MTSKMVKNPPSITSKPPTKTKLILSAKASSTKAFRPGTTAAARLNIRPPPKRRILPNSRAPAATRDVNRKTLATRRRQPFCLLSHNRLLSRHAPNMLTKQKGLSKTTRKSSPRDWTSLATLAASSARGNCSSETLIGTAAALFQPLHLPTNLRRKSRWIATSWTRAVLVVAVAIAMDLRPKASVQLPVDCRRETHEEKEDGRNDMLTERLL